MGERSIVAFRSAKVISVPFCDWPTDVGTGSDEPRNGRNSQNGMLEHRASSENRPCLVRLGPAPPGDGVVLCRGIGRRSRLPHRDDAGGGRRL